ncbi:thymidine kinase [Sphingobacterium pedocola]
MYIQIMLFSEHNFNNRNRQVGSIEVICGSMFSGKTEELIRRMRRAQFAKLKIEIFKPSLDNRYADKEVISHDSNSIHSTPINHSSAILLLSSDTKVIGIDEAQFFDDELPNVCIQLANKGIRVIVAGLDMDYQGKPFGPMPKLLAIAEHIVKVHAVCVQCGAPANYSYRFNDNKDIVLLGEKESYEPRCRHCYYNLPL